MNAWKAYSWESGGAVKNKRNITHCGLCLEKFKRNEYKVTVHQHCLGRAMG
jgi:hypothetical protein